MKSTYEKRWGHARYKKATAHLVVKQIKREQAEQRNALYQSKLQKEASNVTISI